MARLLRCASWVFSTVLLAGMVGCGLKAPAKPQWSVTLRVPLTERSLKVSDLVARTGFLSLDSSGTAALHWSQDLSEVQVGSSLVLPSIQSDVSSPLGDFRLSPTPPAAVHLLLADLWPQLAGSTGQSVMVPPVQFAPVKSAQASGFTSAQVRQGTLQVTVTNNLPVSLDASTLDVANSLGGVLGTLHFGAIAPGDSAAAVINLAGKSVLSSWNGTWTGSSPGSSSAVLLTSAAGVRTSFAFQGPLVVSAAVAPIPAQAFDWMSSAGLPDSERIASATFAGGSLYLSFNNQWGVGGTLHLTLPDLSLPDGSALTHTVQLDAARVVEVSLPLAGTSYVAPDPEHPVLRVQGHLDTPGTSLSQSIASTDPLSVHSELSGVVMNRIQGVFAPFLVVLDPVTRNLDFPVGLGALGLADATGILSITASAGVPAHIVLQISGIDAAGGAWTLQGLAGAPLVLDVPAAPPGGSVSAPLVLSGANSNLPEFLGHVPRQIQVTGTARVGDGHSSASVTSQDFFRGHFEIETALVASFSDSRIGFDTDSVRLGSSVREQIRDRLSRVRLHVTIENGLPLGADATLHLAATINEARNPGPGTITLSASAPAAGGGGQAEGTHPAIQEVVLEISSSQIDVLQHSPIYLGGNVHLPGTAGQKVRIRGQDQVKARAWLEAEGKVVR